MNCYVSANIAAPCAEGHSHDGPVHTTGRVTKQGGQTIAYDVEMWCEQHCPVHGAQASLEWKEPVQTIAGEQEALF